MASQQRHGEFATGMAAVWALNLLGFLAVALLMPMAVSFLSSSLRVYNVSFYSLNTIIRLYVFPFVQITQLPYAIPLWLRFRRRRRFGAAKGVIFGTVVALSLNWALFITLFWMFFRGLY